MTEIMRLKNNLRLENSEKLKTISISIFLFFKYLLRNMHQITYRLMQGSQKNYFES